MPHATAAPGGSSRPHIVIVGGGVIGVSTAIGLLGHPVAPYDVTIVAPDLPSLDFRTYRPHPEQGEAALSTYASAWAGAHHVSDAKSAVQLRRDRVTFDVLCKLEKAWAGQTWAQTSKRPLVYVHQTEYWSRKAELEESAVDWYPQYQRMDKAHLPQDIDFGATFKTLDLDVPKYLPMLFAYFLRLGGRAVRHRATTLSDAVGVAQSSSVPVMRMANEGYGLSTASDTQTVVAKPSAVIASPGLGARELLQDDAVLPVRGQTVLVRAPWCTTEAVRGADAARTTETEWCGVSKVIAAQGGYRDTYVIPRGDGTMICGGTRLEGEWDVAPRGDTTKDILRRVLALVPQLARPKEQQATNGRATNGHAEGESEDAYYNVDIVDVNVGLRPGRRGGIRLERAKETVDDIPLIHNYGFGGIGYQSSWGAAFEARGLVDEALGRAPAPSDSTFAELDSGTMAIPDPSALAASEKLA